MGKPSATLLAMRAALEESDPFEGEAVRGMRLAFRKSPVKFMELLRVEEAAYEARERVVKERVEVEGEGVVRLRQLLRDTLKEWDERKSNVG